MPKIALALISLLLLPAACAPQAGTAPAAPQTAVAPPPASSAPPAQSAAATTPPPGSGPFWDVTQLRCSQLLAADEDDRAAASVFYYGYLAARSGIKVIDVSRVEENIARVMDQCKRTPDLTVPQAYERAFGRALGG
jgi:hypothetical protein